MTSTTDTIPETPISERVAADLRTLADFTTAHPEFAEQIAYTLSAVTIVLPREHPSTPEDVADAAIAIGATSTGSGWQEPHWPTRAVLLPGKAIRLLAVKLDLPDVVTTTEMADAIWGPSHSLGVTASGALGVVTPSAE